MKFVTILAAALGLTAVSPSPSPGQSGRYDFRSIADSNGPLGDEGWGAPSINDRGTVVFTVEQEAGAGGIYAYDGGTIQPLVNDRPGYPGFHVSLPTVLNDAGIIAFEVNDDSLHSNPSLFSARLGGPRTTVFVPEPGVSNLGQWSMNDTGRIAFWASDGFDWGINHGIYSAQKAGEFTRIASTGSTFRWLGPPAIGSNGDVVFAGMRRDGGSGLFRYRADTGTIVTVVDETAGITGIGTAQSVNDAGQVAFIGRREGSAGVFVADGGLITEVADIFRDYAGGTALSINDHGTVAFLANVGGREGLYTSPMVLGSRRTPSSVSVTPCSARPCWTFISTTGSTTAASWRSRTG